MMEPKYERVRLLDAAITAANSALDAPITRIEVSRHTITCWAGSKRVSMIYGYSDSRDQDGSYLLGGGNWWVIPKSTSASALAMFFSYFKGGKR